MKYGEFRRYLEQSPRHIKVSLSAYVSRELRKQNRWKGIKWFTKTNSSGYYNLVSRHYPHQLCWSWILSLHFKGYGHRLFRLVVSRRFQSKFMLDVLWVRLSLLKQDSDWMLWMPRDADVPMLVECWGDEPIPNKEIL